MIKRILLAWLAANFGLPVLAALITGRWYLAWQPASSAVLAESVLIMLPNFLLPILVLQIWGGYPPQANIKSSLGWRWAGRRTVAAGVTAFLGIVLISVLVTRLVGPAIPYHLPDRAPMQAHSLAGGLGLFALLLLFVLLTVMGEETMFRGWVQSQVGKRYGWPVGLLLAAALFGLRHLPADLFYAQAWQSSPAMWISRQVQLYVTAVLLGLARRYGHSTYAPSLAHGLLLVLALFGF